MKRKFLILIPAYNESESIVRVIDNLINKYPDYDYVVINDGSSDNTAKICMEHGYKLIDQPINLGLSGTFQTGAKYALKYDYDAILQFDADGQHRPEHIDEMLKKMEEGYDIVIGSRFVNEKKPLTLRMFGSFIISFLIKMMTGKHINDPTSGMRMYSKRLLPIIANNPNITPEPDTVAYLISNGASFVEVQAYMDERIAGKSYLTAVKSIQYMLTICISILILSWFRPRLKLEDSQ